MDIEQCTSHKLIQDLYDWYKKTKGITELTKYRENLIGLMAYIKVSQKFFIGDLNQYLNLHKWSEDDEPFMTFAKDVKLPYDVTYWQGTMPTKEGQECDTAFLVIKLPEDELYEMHLFIKFKSMPWMTYGDHSMIFTMGGRSIFDTLLGPIYVQNFMKSNYGNRSVYEDATILANKYKNTAHLVAYNMYSKLRSSDSEKENIKDKYHHAMEVLSCVLMLIDCKNINVDEIEPTRNDIKRAKLLKKEPKHSFHILKLIGKSSNSAGEHETNNKGIMPLHLCRGHFKEYSVDNPLFGKVYGRFWWQPFVRGNDKNGTVSKDYQVKAA